MDYEKIAKREVLRKVGKEHLLYEDLMQEARFAIYKAAELVDPTLPAAMATSYLKQAARWRITKAYHAWLRTETNTSVRQLRQGTANFLVRELEPLTIPDPASSKRVAAIEQKRDVATVISELWACAETAEEKVLAAAILDGTELRTLGAQLGCSHQGASNKRERLIRKCRKRLLKGAE